MSSYTHEFYSMEAEYYRRRYVDALERVELKASNENLTLVSKLYLKRTIFAGLSDKFAYDAMLRRRSNREINDIMMHLRALEKLIVRLSRTP